MLLRPVYCAQRSRVHGARGFRKLSTTAPHRVDDACLRRVEAELSRLSSRRTVFKRVRGAPEGPAGRAAVLVGLCRNAATDEPSVLLTVRAQGMRSQPSQVAFPGGREEEGDAGDPTRTALRELEEEVGWPGRAARVLGLSHDAQMPRKMRVTPVVAWLGDVDISTLQLAHAEVASAFLAPLHVLLDPANQRRKKVEQPCGNAISLPVFDVHVKPTQCTDKVAQEHTVWGLTAYILQHCFAEIGKALHTNSDLCQ